MALKSPVITVITKKHPTWTSSNAPNCPKLPHPSALRLATEIQVELRIAVVGMIGLGLPRWQLQGPGAIGDPELVALEVHQRVATSDLHLGHAGLGGYRGDGPRDGGW